jgi:hypothetical protein
MATKSAVPAKGASNCGAFSPSLNRGVSEVRMVIGDYSYDVTAFKGERAALLGPRRLTKKIFCQPSILEAA